MGSSYKILVIWFIYLKDLQVMIDSLFSSSHKFAFHFSSQHLYLVDYSHLIVNLFMHIGASEGAGAGGVWRSDSHRCTNYQQQALYRQRW